MGESVYELTTAALFDLEHTRAAALLAGCEYPWQVLGELKGFIRELGAQLDGTEFERVAEDVWVHRDAHVFGSAYIGGPAIIDAGHRSAALCVHTRRGAGGPGLRRGQFCGIEKLHTVRRRTDAATTTMSAIRYWATRRTWAQAR